MAAENAAGWHQRICGNADQIRQVLGIMIRPLKEPVPTIGTGSGKIWSPLSAILKILPCPAIRDIEFHSRGHVGSGAGFPGWGLMHARPRCVAS